MPHEEKSSQTALESRLSENIITDILKILLSWAEGSELKHSLKNGSTPLPVNSNVYHDEMLQLSLCYSIIGNNTLIAYFYPSMMGAFTLLGDVAAFYKENIKVDYKKYIEICLATHNQT